MQVKKVLGWSVGGLFALGVLGAVFGESDEQPSGSRGSAGSAVVSAPAHANASATASPAPQPELVIDVPDDRDVFRDRVVLRGTVSTDPEGASLAGARVTVDGKTAPLSSGGRWSKTVTVRRGDNDIDIEASGPGFEDSDVETVTLTRRQSKAERAAAAARRAAAAAAKKQSYLASAKAIPYNQLDKNADRYAGTRVKFTGQIFQIQEGYDSTVILLSVTDEGYGFWTDNIWVDYPGTIKGAEDDIITVYGTIKGSKSYETQIGGETYVPQMTARYVVE